MPWAPTTYTLLGLGAGAISGVVAAYALGHREDRTIVAFAGLMVVLAVWPAVYGVQLGYVTAAEQLPWQRVTLGVAGVVPTAWFLFAVHYAGYGDRLTVRHLGVLLVDPIAFLALSLSNASHGLVFEPGGIVQTVGGPVLAVSFGPAYVVHITYAYATVAAGIALMAYIGLGAASMYRTQVALLIGGAVPPFLGHMAYTLGVSPVAHLDLTPFLFTVTGLLFGLALIRYDLLDRRPIAQRHAMRTARHGMLVVDERGVVVDMDDVARRAFEPPPSVGDLATTLFDVEDLSTVDRSFHEVRRAGDRRIYHVRVSPLRDHLGRRRGDVLVLQEVTELRAYEKRLEVSNRVLRHNLRTDTNVIAGYAAEIETAVEDEQLAADARMIRETATDLADLSEKARAVVVNDAPTGEGREAVDVAAVTRDILADFRSRHPACTFAVEAPSAATVTLPGAPTYRTALRNLVENAVEHNDRETPRVRVEIEASDGRTTVTVSDNGPGIPNVEQAVFETGTERPLRHSQGLGMWIAYLSVTEAGGEFSIDADGTGTRVTMTFLE